MARAPGCGRRRLQRQHGHLLLRRSGPERVDRALGSGGRKHQQIARLVERQVHGIQRIVALDRQSLACGPAINALLVMIDEIELAGRIHGRAGNGKESVLQLLHFPARLHDRGRIGGGGAAGAAGTSSTANSRSRTSR